MKKIFCLTFGILFAISALVVPSYASSSTSDFTPGEITIWDLKFTYTGTPHHEYIRRNSTYIKVPHTNYKVEAYLILDELSQETLDFYDYAYSELYPNAVKLREGTVKYNCHSYAWYSTAPDNSYWIDDPYYFHANSSEYLQVTSPQIGDIICYYDNSWNILHSGIVTGFTGQESNGLCGNANTVEVTSKWGFAGVYRHNGYECQYTMFGNGDASRVRYFRKHTHSLVYRNITTYYQHRVSCTTCDFTYTEPHTWKKIRVDLMGCLYCNAITDGPVLLDSVPEDVMTSMDNVLGVGGDGAITYDDGLVLCRIDGDYYLVVGVTTEEAVSYVRNQLTYVRNPEI